MPEKNESIEPPEPENLPETEEQQTSQPEQGSGDALADVRQSLIEEEKVEQVSRKPGLLGRLKNLFARNKKSTPGAEEEAQKEIIPTVGLLTDDEFEEASQAILAMLDEDTEVAEQAGEATSGQDELTLTEAESVPEEEPESKPEHPQSAETGKLTEKMTSLFEDIATTRPKANGTEEFQKEAEPAETPVEPVEEEKAETEVGEYPKPAPKTTRPVTTEAEETYEDMREVALEDYVEPEEVETKTPIGGKIIESVGGLFTGFTKSERMIISGVFFLMVSFFMIYGAFSLGRRSATAAPTPASGQDSLSPIPVSVSLPGGWSFRLTTGVVQDGKWEPTGAEWLKGTEICRWVSLPWSTQLEAVIRTVNAGDPIILSMSNADKFTYYVKSRTQVTPEELNQFPTNEPCLLIILTNPADENRWVLEALPE